jgi:hypothetical protein
MNSSNSNPVINNLLGADDSLTDIVDMIDTTDASLDFELLEWYFRVIGDTPHQGLFII